VLAVLASGLLAREAWAAWQERSARRALAENRLEEAHRHIDQAVRVRAGRLSTRLLAARIARLRGAIAEAAQHLDRCGQPSEMSEQVQLEWLLLRCQRGELDELAPQLLASVDRGHPDSPVILEGLAGAYMQQTRYREALRCLDRWIERVPSSVRALDWRGWVFNQLDHRGQAFSDYERALELDPSQSAVRLRLAEILVDSSRHADAVPHLERLHEEQPTNPDVLVLLGRCRMAQSRPDEARTLFDAVLEERPDDFEALLRCGQLELSQLHYAQAERWLHQALQKKPLDPEARYSLVRTLQAQPDRGREAEEELARWKQARHTQDRLARLVRIELPSRPKDPELAREAGELFLGVGENKHGVYWLNRALRLDPGNAASHRALIAHYERIGKSAEAAEHRQKLEALGR
jgi:tetratricopeptide (TPR) repeat protein